MPPNAAFVPDDRLLSLANQIAACLNAPFISIYQEAVSQAQASPCTAEEILNGWLAIARKNGIPRQLASYVQKTRETYRCTL